MPDDRLDIDGRHFSKVGKAWPEAFVSHRYNNEKPMDSSHPAAPYPPKTTVPEVSIIIPARNEEASIGACLASVISQTGVVFEIIVVDDASIDRTRAIAQTYSNVRIISPELLPAARIGKNWSGKNNAVIAGAKQARAPWLLFTDADTVHGPGSLARALEEAVREQADLLSYSPQQVVVTFAERAVMPVIFAELAAHYPPHKVRAASSNTAAANGQYILVRREAYEAVGGHVAVASEILEDVALARLFRDAGYRIHFRYGGDAVRTRMYRNWPQLREGWTKNLALLFPQTARLAFQSCFLWFMAWSSLGIGLSSAISGQFLRIGFLALWILVYGRIRMAHFSTWNNLLAIAVGLPMFAYLLLRSKCARASGQVLWKGRTYKVENLGRGKAAKKHASPAAERKNQELRAEN
jgi:glycosyltransferase involved in cell wall biosynthesis